MDANYKSFHGAIIDNNLEKVNSLIKSGLDIDREITNLRKTPLQYAADIGYADLVQILLQNGANPRIGSNKAAATPLHIAAKKGDVELADLLLDEKKPAGFFSKLFKSNSLIDIQDINGDTPLHIASKYAQFKMVLFLLENGANSNKLDRNGENSIHALCHGHISLPSSKINERVKIANILIQYGCNSKLKSKSGITPESILLKDLHQWTVGYHRGFTPSEIENQKIELKELQKSILKPQIAKSKNSYRTGLRTSREIPFNYFEMTMPEGFENEGISVSEFIENSSSEQIIKTLQNLPIEELIFDDIDCVLKKNNWSLNVIMAFADQFATYKWYIENQPDSGHRSDLPVDELKNIIVPRLLTALLQHTNNGYEITPSIEKLIRDQLARNLLAGGYPQEAKSVYEICKKQSYQTANQRELLNFWIYFCLYRIAFISKKKEDIKVALDASTTFTQAAIDADTFQDTINWLKSNK